MTLTNVREVYGNYDPNLEDARMRAKSLTGEETDDKIRSGLDKHRSQCQFLGLTERYVEADNLGRLLGYWD